MKMFIEYVSSEDMVARTLQHIDALTNRQEKYRIM